MKNYLFIIIITFSALPAFAQEIVTLSGCIEKAVKIHPVARQKEIFTEIESLKLKNLDKNFLPKIMLNGQASYQSDVVEIPIRMPGLNIEEMNKDWYKLTLDVNQTLYDGSYTSAMKKVQKAESVADRQGVEVDLYALKDRVIQVFFNIAMQQENLKILGSVKNTLETKLTAIGSGVAEGIILPAGELSLKAEIAAVEQKIFEVENLTQALKDILSEFTGMKLGVTDVIRLPEIPVEQDASGSGRPELPLFGLQKDRLEAMKKITRSSLLPRISAFGQAGYGRPGLNMLSNNFETFYMVGARLSWNILDWRQASRDRQQLGFQSDLITTKKETFEKNLRIDLINRNAEIRRTAELIKSDLEIIDLRTLITAAASAQLDNGIITVADYITELNTETQARLNLELHRVQHAKAHAEYMNATGKL